MDSPENSDFDNKTLYTFLREKHRTEIRKAQTSSLFKTKRLFFQIPKSTKLENPANEVSNQIITTEEAKTVLSRTLDEALDAIVNRVPENPFLESLSFLRIHIGEQPMNHSTTIYLLNKGLFDVLYDLLNEICKFTHPIQEEIVWLLCNVTYLSVKETPLYKREKFVRPLNQLLFKKSHNINELVMWTLNNMADDDPHSREAIVKEGVFLNYREILLSSKMVNVRVLTNFLTLLYSICLENKDIYYSEVLKHLDLIMIGLVCEEEEAFGFVVAMFMCLFQTSTENYMKPILDKLEDGNIRQIFGFYSKIDNPKIKSNCLSAISDFLSYDDKWTNIFLECGICSFLMYILDNEKNNDIIRLACFSLSNCLASEPVILGKVLNHAIFDHFVWKTPSQDYKINKEIIYCLINILSFGTIEQVAKTIRKGYLDLFAIVSDVSEANLVFSMLTAVEIAFMKGREMQENEGKNEIMMEICKGPIPNWIVSLQDHPDTRIYEKSYHMVMQFFECEQNIN